MGARKAAFLSMLVTVGASGCLEHSRRNSPTAEGEPDSATAPKAQAQPATRAAASADADRRETVLDRRIHLEREIVRDIPHAPRWCDLIDSAKVNLSVGDCELFCELQGVGIPLVLVHGGPGATHHYFHPSFCRAADFARVIYYDQRGCGLSDYDPGDGYTFSQAIDDLAKLRTALGVDRWIVLGHSYGGRLAQHYAVRYPDHLAGLVLVGASPASRLGPLPSRQRSFLSDQEWQRIRDIPGRRDLPVEQKVYNAFLNGDWKRQHYYKPSEDKLTRLARYEWKHDRGFNDAMSSQSGWLKSLEGAFQGCPIPTLILEGAWDLTWSKDKPEKLHQSLPGSRLVMFEASGHSPFDDEPEKFFAVLGEFIESAEQAPPPALAAWKRHLGPWNEEPAEDSPAHLLRSVGWGMGSSRKIAEAYSVEWLDELSDSSLLLRTGFALYDVERYEEALVVLQDLHAAATDDALYNAVALVWQGHLFDLLGRRREAVAAYQRVVDMKVAGRMQHSQYGMTYAPSAYAAKRLTEPFRRVENQSETAP